MVDIGRHFDANNRTSDIFATIDGGLESLGQTFSNLPEIVAIVGALRKLQGDDATDLWKPSPGIGEVATVGGRAVPGRRRRCVAKVV